jgi:hypothetical protein
MRFKIIIITLAFFVLMASSGLILYFGFQESSFVLFWGLSKTIWQNIHIFFAVSTLSLIVYHIGVRWNWVEQIIFRKTKEIVSKEIIRKRWNNTWFFIVLSLSVSTGFLSWLLHEECSVCTDYHGKIGFVLILVFLTHLYKHRKSFRMRS